METALPANTVLIWRNGWTVTVWRGTDGVPISHPLSKGGKLQGKDAKVFLFIYKERFARLVGSIHDVRILETDKAAWTGKQHISKGRHDQLLKKRHAPGAGPCRPQGEYMKGFPFLSAIVTACLLAAQAAAADSHASIGGTTFRTFDDGTAGTSTTIGGITFHDFSDGVGGTSVNIGGGTLHNFSNGVGGTSTRLGRITLHDFSNGVSGSSTDMGGMTFDAFDEAPSAEADGN